MTQKQDSSKKFLSIYNITIFCLVILRFVNLDKIPIFIDEQAHLYFGEFSFQNFTNLFITVQHRIFPVVPWILGLVQMIFARLINPLTLGRATMIVADVASSILIFLIGKKLFNKKYALLASLIYLSLPLNFFHSRVVLLEPITNMFFLAGLYFFIQVLIQKKISDIKLLAKNLALATIAFSLSFLSKPTILASFTAVPLLLINTIVSGEKQKFKGKIFLLVILAVFFALIVSPIVIPVWHKFADLFVWTNKELLVANFKRNLHLTWWWSKVYITLPIMFLVIISFFYTLIFKKFSVLWIYFWLLAVIILNSIFAMFFFPRHMYPMAAPISLITAWAIFEISKKLNNNAAAIALLILILAPSLKLNLHIITDPSTAPIALEDRQQFFEDWTSGKGLEGIAVDLKRLSKDKKTLVLIEKDGGFGWSLKNVYNVNNATIVESDEISKNDSILNLPNLTNEYSQTYIVLNRNTEPPSTWPIELVSSFPKLTNIRFMKIYKLKN